MENGLVVGYDGSPASKRALDYAATRARAGGRVVVLHAFGPPAAEDTDRRGHQERSDECREKGERLIEALRADSESPLMGVDYEPELRGGAAAEQLVESARRHDAKEIVVGARGLTPLLAALGSVSHDLLHLADRPVVIVPPPAERSK